MATDARAAQQVVLAVVAGFVAGVIGSRLATPAATGPARDEELRAQVDVLTTQLAELPSPSRFSELEQALEQLSAGPAANDGDADAAEFDPHGQLTAELLEAIDADSGAELVARYEALLARGLDPRRPGAGGLPPLVVASGHGRLELVRRLLQDVDPNQRGEAWGQTALVAATSAGEAAIVELLLEVGADPTVVCGPCDGPSPYVTALSLARSGGHEALAARLQQVVGHWPGRRMIAAVVGHLVAAPGPKLAEAPLTIELGRADGSWGRYSLTVGAEQVVVQDPFVLPALLGEQVFEVEVRWRQGERSGTQRMFLNKPNANEPVVAAVLELGSWPTNARVELVVDPIAPY